MSPVVGLVRYSVAHGKPGAEEPGMEKRMIIGILERRLRRQIGDG